MSVQVASLHGLLELRDTATSKLQAFDSQLTNVTGRLNQLGGRLQGFGGNMSGMGIGITSAMSPFIEAATNGIALAADFEATLAEIQMRAGLTGEEIQRVSDFALQLGAETMFSGQQVAEAFLQLLTSGNTVEEAFGMLPSILDAAAAGGMDLGQTADLITDIMAGFGLGVDETKRSVNWLARAAGSSSASMQQLMEALVRVGPVASQFGFNFLTTTVALAQMANFGIKGVEAGTQLRSMITNLNRDVPDVRRAFERLNVSLYNIDGSARPASDVLTELSQALSMLSDEERNVLVQTMAGVEGMAAFNAIMAGDGLLDLAVSFVDAASASEIASARMNTFQGRVNELKGSVETLAITVMTPFMKDVLKPMIEQLTTIVNRVTDFAAANPELTTSIITVGAAVAIFGITLTGLGLTLKIAAAAVSGLTLLLKIAAPVVSRLTLLLTPLGGVLLLIAALITAYMTDFLGFQGFVNGLGDMFRDAKDGALIFAKALPVIISRWDEARPLLETEIRNFISRQADFFVERFNALVPGLGDMLRDAFVGVMIWVRESLEIIIDGFKSGIDAISQAWQNFFFPQPQPQVIQPISPLNPFGGGMASGGMVQAGRSYLVGERGAEIFIPGQSGTIVPNDRIGGMTIQNLTIHADGLNPREVERVVARALLEVMRR